jgi:hypothetical protein
MKMKKFKEIVREVKEKLELIFFKKRIIRDRFEYYFQKGR